MSSLLAESGPSVLESVSAALSEVAGDRLWAQSDTQILDRVQLALRVRAQADAVLLAALGEAESRGLARKRGASSTRAWLTAAHRVDPAEAGRLVRAAGSLRSGFEQTGQALASGDVSLDQARVIIHAIDQLPADLGPDLVESAESLMVGHAEVFDPATLVQIGRRLAEVIDPQGTQARDEKNLLEAERTAHGKRGVTITVDRDGAGRHIRGYLDAEAGAVITAALDGLSAPIPVDAAGQPDQRSPAQRTHDALLELCRRQLACGGLPATGGIKPRIVITIPAQSLADRTGAGRLADGQQLSPTLTRMIGCDAEFITAVLDDTGSVLNLGRSRRTFTGRARTALDLRDRGCAWPGCTRPPAWAQAHHIIPWVDGGATDQNNGVLLCGSHHREIERGDWTVTIRRGRAWFTPPTRIDPGSTPTRHPSSTPCTTRHRPSGPVVNGHKRR